MNILLYCPFKFSLKSRNLKMLGGIETLNLELSKELAIDGYKIFLATYCNKKINVNNIENIPINKIFNKSENYKFDIIISSNNSQIFDFYKSAKKIFWMHNTLSIEKAIRKKKIISLIKNKITVVFVSKYLKNITSNFFLFNKKKIIYNFLSNYFTNQKKQFIRKKIFVWSVQRNKGLSDTLNMRINKVYIKDKNAKLLVFGIDKNKVKKITYFKKFNIYFMGRVSKNYLKNVYSKSLGMICLGYDETFCLNALEANACGLPVLTFGKTALKEFSIDKYNSYVVNDFDSLSDRILNMCKSTTNKVIINNSYKHSKKFNIKLIKQQWIKLINSV